MSKFISLAELNNSEAVEAVHFQLRLPDYTPAENILVNARRIGRITRWGGVSDVTFTSYAGEINSYTPEIVGIENDGTALAGTTGTLKKAEQGKVHLQYDEDRPLGLPVAYNWAAATISLESGGRVCHHKSCLPRWRDI